ncbi:MAG: nuclear transport factor 2 family protein [Candidatus Eremiobacteraeota bacterium]|nr:nuclear transport factor 2 family protein [Candidatus Eremiobacteraeota bacterium]MBC5827845.1 nuclear transport factor 2 family protein [Candidatus Eremiobacteraeota bacterium]
MRKTIVVLGSAMVILAARAPGAPSDVATVRALRLENNRAIRAHDTSRMRRAWSAHIRLIETDGTLISGARLLATSYVQREFQDASFVSYVRIPKSVVISFEGARAAEYGTWTAIYKEPKQVQSGNYFASWQKSGGQWKIVYEAYVSLGLEPQSVADVLKPTAAITLRGTPDWLLVTPDSLWVSNGALKTVQRIDVATSRLVASVRMPGEPCSGLAFGFGSVWVPLCETHPSLARVDSATNAVVALLPIAPALSEGGITTSGDSVWMATGDGTLARIDPKTNRIRQRISISRGS